MFAVESSSHTKMLAIESFCDKFYQIHKGEIINILYKVFPQREKEETIANSFWDHYNSETKIYQGHNRKNYIYTLIYLININAKILNSVVASWIFLVYSIFHTAACHLKEKHINNFLGNHCHAGALPFPVCRTSVQQICLGILVFFHCRCCYPMFRMERNSFTSTVRLPAVTTITPALMLIWIWRLDFILFLNCCSRKLETTNRTRARARQMSQKQNQWVTPKLGSKDRPYLMQYSKKSNLMKNSWWTKFQCLSEDRIQPYTYTTWPHHNPSLVTSWRPLYCFLILLEDKKPYLCYTSLS